MKEYQQNIVRLLKYSLEQEIEIIINALIANKNDVFHAKCEIESKKPYNYLELKYNYNRNLSLSVA
jgi:hypothetical protein